MRKLLDSSGLREPLAERCADGLPVLGTCAGLILLAARCSTAAPTSGRSASIDVTVRRNGYGRQRDSFEADLDVARARRAARSPACSSARRSSSGSAPAVEVLAEHDGVPVLVRAGPRAGSRRSIPSSSGDLRLHQRFLHEEVEHDVRPFQVALDQAQEGRGRRGARQALRQARSARSRSRRARAAATSRRNPTLRTMVQKARDASVPIDTIERAIKRGTGELEGVTYEQSPTRATPRTASRCSSRRSPTTATAPAPRSRTSSRRNGGSLAEPGAVAWQFERKGVVIRRQGAADEDDLMLVAARRRRRGHRRPGRHVAGHHAADRPARGAHRARGGRASRSTSADLTMLPTTDGRARRGERRRRRCCG